MGRARRATTPRLIGRLFPPEYRGDNRDYTPFVVFTAPRSGSSFVMQLLRSHPAVVAFGEILGPGNVWLNVPGFPSRHRGLKRLRDRRPVAFMESYVFGGYRDGVEAVGFKLHHAHLEAEAFRPLAGWLRGMSPLRVVALERRNLLRAYLSTVVRSKTGVGWIYAAADRRPVTVTLDPEGCERYFARHLQRKSRASRLVEGHALLRVTYEDLVSDRNGETARMLAFLGVSPREVSSRTVVQEVRPLAEAISNYAELEDRFQGTEWEAFLD